MDIDTVIKNNTSAFYKNKFAKQKIAENYKKKAQKEIIEKSKEIAKNNIIIEIYKILCNEDISYKLFNNLSKRATNKLKNEGIERTLKHSELIGCDKDKLKLHIENKFTDDMTFDNYGLWELDHIIPISSFNLKNIEEQKKCFNYNNIQPLWKQYNLKKSAKLDWVKNSAELSEAKFA